jgi:citrate lyase beta subunit
MSERSDLLPFVFTLFTDEPELAARADEAGVDRIGLDLERLGKESRQSGLGTLVSTHEEQALPQIRSALRNAQLFVRVNPIHPGSRLELDRVLGEGAEVLMLPMFTSVEEVRLFVDLVAGRATCVLLLETPAAVEAVRAIVAVEGVGEVHVGLTDLSIALGLKNRFMPLALPLMVDIARAVHEAGLPFGVGGVIRVGDDRFAVPSDLIYAQYPRLGARRALISRSFLNGIEDFPEEMRRARDKLDDWWRATDEQLEAARAELARVTGAAKAF